MEDHGKSTAVVSGGHEFDEDAEFVREQMKELFKVRKDAIDAAAELVEDSSEHPRALEVLTKMVSDQEELLNKMLDFHKKKNEAKGPAPVGIPDKVTNNNIFIGTTTDLSKMIEEKRAAKAKVVSDDGIDDAEEYYDE